MLRVCSPNSLAPTILLAFFCERIGFLMSPPQIPLSWKFSLKRNLFLDFLLIFWVGGVEGGGRLIANRSRHCLLGALGPVPSPHVGHPTILPCDPRAVGGQTDLRPPSGRRMVADRHPNCMSCFRYLGPHWFFFEGPYCIWGACCSWRVTRPLCFLHRFRYLCGKSLDLLFKVSPL